VDKVEEIFHSNGSVKWSSIESSEWTGTMLNVLNFIIL